MTGVLFEFASFRLNAIDALSTHLPKFRLTRLQWDLFSRFFFSERVLSILIACQIIQKLHNQIQGVGVDNIQNGVCTIAVSIQDGIAVQR